MLNKLMPAVVLKISDGPPGGNISGTGLVLGAGKTGVWDTIFKEMLCQPQMPGANLRVCI